MTDTGMRLPVLAVLAVGALVLVGCGSSNKPAGSGSAVASGSSATSAGASAGASAGTSAGASVGAPKSTGGGSATGAGSAAPSGTATSAPTGSAHPGSTASSAGGQEGATGPSLNDCTLATAANVVAAFGGKVVTSGASTTGTGAQLCKFQVTNARAAKNLTITFSTHKPVRAADFQSGEATAVKAGATPVSGVGNGAYFVRSSATLQFLSGSTGGFVQVQAPMTAGSATGAIQSGATALAKAIIAGL